MHKKKLIAIFLTLAMLFNIACPAAFAAETEGIETALTEELGVKKAELIDREDNHYNITIEVPGKDGDKRHDEVILMVDGSYSMDNEWPAMKEAINTIGRTVLNGSGITQLTLMAFGMGDNEVLVHVKDADELAAALGELPGNLLYGRSSTNCEAGFDGVANYIKNHDDSLKDVHVIFISDGNVNTDETSRVFDANWQTWTKFGALAVAQEAFGGTVSNGEALPAAFYTVFGDRFDGATNEEIISRAFGGEVTDEEFIAFAEQLWTDVYAYSGLTRGEEYPVSVAERAFVKYDKENGTYIQDLFYYTTYKSAYVTYGDRWARTPAAANVLAAMDEVAAMYVVDYDGYTAWMDTGITSEKSTFVQSKGIAGLCQALEGALGNLAQTPFNDVVVTDYMSKWVNLAPATIKIIDNNSDKVIWSAVEGWLVTDNIPTDQNPPVAVELVSPEAYEAGGEDVAGNENGDIYKLTWYIKDGALLRSDSYKLSYEVTVDTNETGFEYGMVYPANGETKVHYNQGNSVDIKVPNVKVNREDKGGITVVKETTGNTAPNGPFMFKLFVQEELASPYTSEITAAEQLLKETVDSVINEDTVYVTTGSAYTLQGTTMSHYVFALFNGTDTPVTMAVTSGSAMEFGSPETLNWMNIESAGSDIVDAIKGALLKAYTSLFDMLEGLYSGLRNENTTVVIAQEALEPVVKAGQLYNDAIEKDKAWKTENSTASALQITIGDYTYSTNSPEVAYNAEHDRWELEFQVTPGAENAVNICMESTTGSIISYTIAEDAAVYSDENYVDTEMLDSTKENSVKGLTLSKLTSSDWVTLGNNIYGDSYIFQNNYKTVVAGSDSYIPEKEKDKQTPDVLPDESIDDPDVPLGDMNLPDEPAIPDEELDDPEIPLGDAPATGDTNNAAPFMALMLFAVAGLVITRRKFN